MKWDGVSELADLIQQEYDLAMKNMRSAAAWGVVFYDQINVEKLERVHELGMLDTELGTIVANSIKSLCAGEENATKVSN